MGHLTGVGAVAPLQQTLPVARDDEPLPTSTRIPQDTYEPASRARASGARTSQPAAPSADPPATPKASPRAKRRAVPFKRRCAAMALKVLGWFMAPFKKLERALAAWAGKPVAPAAPEPAAVDAEARACADNLRAVTASMGEYLRHVMGGLVARLEKIEAPGTGQIPEKRYEDLASALREAFPTLALICNTLKPPSMQRPPPRDDRAP